MFQTLGSGPIPKRFHTKSKRGCKECKRRKVKCDERKPVCGNCERHFDAITQCEWDDGVAPAGSSRNEARLNCRSQPRNLSNESTIRPVDMIRSIAIELQSVRGAVPPASPLWRTIRGEMIDPFGTHPDSNMPDADGLMKYYFSTVVFQTFPWQPESEKNPVTKYYTPLIWTDTVMYHAILQFSAFRLENKTSRRRGIAKRLMGECVQLLNHRVQDPLLRISDQTIGAVTTLATVEYENGDMRLFRMHLAGLKQMCSMRGGLSAIRSSSPMLANMVLWTFVVAMTETSHLQLDPSDVLETPNWLFDARASFSHPEQLDLPAYGVNDNISTTIIDVNCLSQGFMKHTDYTTADECLSALTFICNTLQRLLSLPRQPPSANPSEACRLATALHLMTPWRGLRPDPVLVINDLLHKLKACLMPLLYSGDSSNELVLWLLFTGGVSALAMPERSWFVSHLVAVVGDLDLARWEQVRACLKRVIWHEALCERSYRRLWEEVRLQKKDLDGTIFL